MHNITIRPAKIADLGGLRELYRQLNPDDPPWPCATWIGTCVSTCMLVGCANFTRRGRPFALIENVVTHQHHRRQGYGRKIVQHAMEAARQPSCQSSTLPAGGSGDLFDQSGAARLGELLRGLKLRRVLQLHSRLGGKEGPAPPDESTETAGLRLDAVE